MKVKEKKKMETKKGMFVGKATATLVLAGLLAMTSCKEPNDDPDPNNPGNGNGNGQVDDKRNATAVYNDIVRLIAHCKGKATLEECAECLDKVIEEQNKKFDN